jgi:hypothetical protein
MRDMGSLLAKLGWTPEGHRRQGLPVLPIAEAARQAQAGQVVKIRGRVHAAEQGGLIAPFSGRIVVSARVQYLKRSDVASETAFGLTRGSTDDWNAELDERRAVPFWVDDGTSRALVLVEGADVSAPLEEVEVPPHMRDAVHAFLSDRVVVRAPVAPLAARLIEAAIAAGDRVEVIGPARLEPIEQRAQAYRDAAAPSLVFFAGHGPEGLLSIQKL